MATPRFAKGTQVQIETSAGSGVFPTLPGVGEISYDPGDVEEEDLTNHSTVGNRREFYPTLAGRGTLSFPLTIWDQKDAEHAKLRADSYAAPRPVRAMRLRFPQLNPVEREDFNGFLATLRQTYSPTGYGKADCSITISGASTTVIE